MRAIDADKIIAEIREYACDECDHDDCCYACAYAECLERLEKAQTVETVTVHQNGANNITMTNCGVLNL